MDANTWVKIVCGLILLAFFIIPLIEIRKIQNELEKRNKIEDEFLFRMTDSASIEAEMERTADLRELRGANRTTLPREDSGPSARIYRPKLRGQMPGSWRPRNPAVFHKIDREDD